LDLRSIRARKDWMDHWTGVSTQFLQPPAVKRSLKSWQGVVRSGLGPPKVTPKHTGRQRG
jgi:hypothetical protein